MNYLHVYCSNRMQKTCENSLYILIYKHANFSFYKHLYYYTFKKYEYIIYVNVFNLHSYICIYFFFYIYSSQIYSLSLQFTQLDPVSYLLSILSLNLTIWSMYSKMFNSNAISSCVIWPKPSLFNPSEQL